MRIYAAQLNPTIGAFEANTARIIATLDKARQAKCDLVLFPELAINGYPPEDLLLLESFIQASEFHLSKIIAASRGLTVIVGLVRRGTGGEKPLHNSAAIIDDGKLLGFQDKTLLPTYDIFDERRYFEPSESCKTWKLGKEVVAITICEDIWREAHGAIQTEYRRDTAAELAPQKPTLHLNLSASPYSYDKFSSRLEALGQSAKALQCPALLCNQVGGNDSLIFDGHSFLVDKEGRLLARAKGFTEDALIVDTGSLPSPITLSTNRFPRELRVP